MRLRALAAIASMLSLAALVGCAGPTLQTLAKPAYVWGTKENLCGRLVAMDADGVLWVEGGCENPNSKFSRLRDLTADERSKIEGAFAALPPGTREPFDPACRVVHRFIVMRPEGYSEWAACASTATEADLTSGLPEPYANVVRSLPSR